MFLKKLFHSHTWQVVKIISGEFTSSWFGGKPSPLSVWTVAKCLQCRTCGEKKLDADRQLMDAAPHLAMEAYDWLNEEIKDV